MKLICPKFLAGTRLARIAMLAVVVLMAGAASLCHAQESVQKSSTAKPADPKALVKRLQRHYQQTNSFRAAFKETIARVGAPPQDRSGTVYFEKPGRIRFEFGDSQPETIVSDGNLIYDYDPELNQVIETPLKKAIKTQAVAAFLLGIGNIERDFSASRSSSPTNDDLSHVLLTPRHGGDAIELGLQPHSLNIVSIRLADSLGNVTTLNFNNIDLNVTIESSRFEFEVPVGADVVTAAGGK